MNEFYVYNSELLCTRCAESIREEIGSPDPDSECWPQGPYDSEANGESDSPDHCGRCSEFLHVPLTEDGLQYMAERVFSHLRQYCGVYDGSHVAEWIEEYNGFFEDLLYSIECFAEVTG